MGHANPHSPEAVRRFLRYRWSIYGIQLICIALVTSQFVIPATIGDQLAGLWHLDAAALGMLGSVLFYTYALLQIPSGYFSDTWGPRRTISLAMLVMATGQVAFSLSHGFEHALAGRALTGLGGGIVLIALLKTLAIWFRAREFATLVGVINVAAFGGAMLATAPLAYLSMQWGWRTPLAVAGILSFILAALNWILMRDDPRELGLPTIGEVDSESASRKRDGKGKPRLSEALRAWASTPSWVVSVAVLLGYGSFLAFQSLWAGPYLIQVHEKSPVATGASLLMLSIGAGLGPLVAGYLSDGAVMARKPLLIAGAAGILVVWGWILATTMGSTTLGMNLAYLLLSFFAGALLIGQTMIKEYVRPEVFGMVFGIFNMLLFIANALFQLLMGWLLSISGATLIAGNQVYSPAGYRLAFTLPAISCALTVLLVLRVPESLKRVVSERVVRGQ